MADNPYIDQYQPPLAGIPQLPPPGNPEEGQPYESMHGDTRLLQFPDGSAAIGEDPQALSNHEMMNEEDHYQNIAKVLPEQDVRQLGFELKNAVEEDIQSQESYFEAIANAIRLLGLDIEGTNEKEDLPFEGATGICSTALFESLLDMLATATSSLYPPTGMVDTVVQGESTQELLDRAYRKKLFFNYYLTQVAKEYKKDARRALSWAILAGSCYKKVYIDPLLQRPVAQFIRPEDFIIHSHHATHLTAMRKTHIIRMGQKDLKLRIMSGRYRDETNLIKEDQYRADVPEIQDALNETMGIDLTHTGRYGDEEYLLYEIHCEHYLESDPKAPPYDLPMPYIVTIDAKSGYVLDICRNWDPQDVLRKKKEYFVNYSLLPSLEGEGYGLTHYAGRLSEAATMIKRQLINTGTYANFPGGLYAAGIRVENNNLRPAPGEFVPVQTGGLAIDQVISPLPYKEPSPTLGALLTQIEDSIKRPSAIINQKVAEMTPQAPMGSVLAMLESLQKVPNAILEGFHESFSHELMLFNDRFAEWLPPNVPYPFKVPGGEHQIMKTDFDDDILVTPASNPALQNSSFRFMQSEIILNQARQGADIHNMRFAYEYFYKNLGLSPEEIKELIPSPQENPPPFSGDPVTENTYLMTNKPVQATLTQDHAAHMMVHQLILANPNTTPEVGAATKAHLQEHEAQQFLVDMQARLGFQLPPDASQIPPEMQNQIAVMASQVAQQKMQEQQAQQPPPPMDPVLATVEIEKMKIDQKRETDTQKLANDAQKLSMDRENEQTKLMIEQMRLQLEEDKIKGGMDIETMKIQQKQEADAMKFSLEEKTKEVEYMKAQNMQLYKQLEEVVKHLDLVKEESISNNVPLPVEGIE